MIRFSSRLQNSFRYFLQQIVGVLSTLFKQIRGNTSTKPERLDVGIKPFDELPTAKKFLGIIDLEVVRWPISKFHELNEMRRRKLGDIYMFQPVIFMKKMLFISSPGLITELCTKEGEIPTRGVLSKELPNAKKRIGLETQGLLYVNGTEWKRLRCPISNRLLHQTFVSSYFPMLSEKANRTVRDIIEIKQTQNEFAPVIKRLYLWAINSVDDLLFHKTSETTMAEEPSQFLDPILTIIQSIGNAKGRSLMERITNKQRNKLIEACRTIAQYARRQIQLSNTTSKVYEQVTLLEYLQNETDFDENEFVETYISFLGAGVDTITKSTQWFWYNLAKYPNVQDKLYGELHSVIGDSPVITEEHYNKLHYMKMCLKESMRVNPTVSAYSRILTEDTTMGGYQIPKSTLVIANVYAIQHDERFWEDPNEFKPERWENRTDIDPALFFPFGIGPRHCVGRKIAEANMVLITAHLCLYHKIQLEQEPDVTFEAFMLPEGLNLSFEERH